MEALVAEADGTDEMTQAYEDEMRRLQGPPWVSYTYGERPTITSLTVQLLADIQRGK